MSTASGRFGRDGGGWGGARRLGVVLLLFWAGTARAQAQTPLAEVPAAAPTGAPHAMAVAPPVVTAVDTPDDAGNSISLSWPAVAGAAGYVVSVGPSADGPWTQAAEIPPEQSTFDWTGAEPGTPYFFRVALQGEAVGPARATVVGPVVATAQWFNMSKLPLFILGAVICGFVIFFIRHARRGGKLFIRRIAGLEAIDEAIGRSVEMGRPILFVPGIMDMDNVQTLAGLTLLGHVAKTVAEYDTQLDVPVAASLVMTAGREVIQQSYLQAGRPDAYNDNMVHFLTNDQFGYVAGVNGIIVRDHPATCFYQGAFYAESLILAETGNAAGAIQIAGTAMPSQLPFFVAACDYTLIGEELFAASAYLSHDAQQLGSLKGQDVGKLIAMVAIALGSLIATVAAMGGEGSALQRAMQPVMDLLHGVFR
jgi:hypothetical protein